MFNCPYNKQAHLNIHLNKGQINSLKWYKPKYESNTKTFNKGLWKSVKHWDIKKINILAGDRKWGWRCVHEH